VTLIVPDGNWRQASKVRARVPGLCAIPCVTLSAPEPSRYRLRSEAHPHGLATMEAIARALGLLEGPAVRHALEHVFDVMVERTLWMRGSLAEGLVTGGIPSGASKHGSVVPARSAL
jgi:DTW domain-containing protein